MARTTKADLEKEITELKEKNKHLLDILDKDNQKYNELLEQKTSAFHELPEYQRMEKEIKQLEEVKKANEATIQHKEKTESVLRNKIQELLAENEQLRSVKNQTVINGSIHNPKNAGRKPKSEDITQQQINQIEFYLSEKKTGKEISSLMGISERTFYRLKKLAKYRSRN